MPRTGFIDHTGIGVPDLAAAKLYYDELMPTGTRARVPLTPWHRPAAPVLHGVQPHHGPPGTRMGRCPPR
jgi:hypothetical protein